MGCPIIRLFKHWCPFFKPFCSLVLILVLLLVHWPLKLFMLYKRSQYLFAWTDQSRCSWVGAIIRRQFNVLRSHEGKKRLGNTTIVFATEAISIQCHSCIYIIFSLIFSTLLVSILHLSQNNPLTMWSLFCFWKNETRTEGKKDLSVWGCMRKDRGVVWWSLSCSGVPLCLCVDGGHVAQATVKAAHLEENAILWAG